MKRKCRFCDKWHMDFDCPSKPSSYSVSLSLDDQWHSSSDDDVSEPDDGSGESETDESAAEEPRRRWRSTRDIPATYHNVYSNSPPDQDPSTEMKLPRASHYRVKELPIAFSVGTGVSYLSVQPCPVKAWIGESLASGIRPTLADWRSGFGGAFDHCQGNGAPDLHCSGIAVEASVWWDREQQDSGAGIRGSACSSSKCSGHEWRRAQRQSCETVD